MTIDADRHWVYLLETDRDAIAAAARRLRTLGLALTFGALGTIGLEVAVRLLFGPISSSPAIVLLVLSMIVVLPAGVAYLILPRSISLARIDIMVGGDFLSGPTATGAQFLEYKKVRSVRLDLSKGRIVGATVAARISAVHAKRVKDPAVLVRAIFERAPETVKWRRSRRPFTRLSREEVRQLIEQSQAPPLEELVPASATLARVEEMFPPAKCWRDRLFGKGAPVAISAVSRERPTGVSRYVGLMFLQMFEDGPASRVLKRSESLPVLTFRTETAEPPPLEDVLEDLKGRCGIDAKRHCGPVDGTIAIRIQRVPCRVLCRFDDSSDVCCQLRLERMTEQELREAEQKR